VVPNTQQYHPSSAKFWLKVGISGGTPDNQYNVSSVTDVAVGKLGVTLNNHFASANWVSTLCITDTTFPSVFAAYELDSSKAVGSAQYECETGGGFADPVKWQIVGFGDQ
jgi:hypothetical protein